MFNNKYFKYKKKYLKFKGGSLSINNIQLKDFREYSEDQGPYNIPSFYTFYYKDNDLDNDRENDLENDRDNDLENDRENDPEITKPNLFDYYIDIFLDQFHQIVVDNNGVTVPTLLIQFSKNHINDIIEPLKTKLFKKLILDLFDNIFNNPNYNDFTKNQLALTINTYFKFTYNNRPETLNNWSIIKKVWSYNPELNNL